MNFYKCFRIRSLLFQVQSTIPKYSMKIKEQTRKLAAGCSKHRFEVVDITDEVSSKHCFEVVDGTDVVSILHIR